MKSIIVTGGAGFLGRHVVALLNKKGYDVGVVRSKSYDLRRREDCEAVVQGADGVVHLAANVGGIGYNLDNPATLFYDNASMGIHLIDAAYRLGVKKLLVVGTICAYPKYAPVPFKERELWNGYPEETNAPYGLAKKMLLVQSQAYRDQYGFNAIYLLPVNLYGEYDNFDDSTSHVIPALIKRFIKAQQDNAPTVTIWGTGKPTREFLYVKDAAEGIVKAFEHYNGRDPVNLGSGREISIKRLAELIGQYVGYTGTIVFDPSKPDGQPRRRLDTSWARDKFNFVANTKFTEGLKNTIEWYRREVIDNVSKKD